MSKVAVSIPQETLEALERTRRKLGTSRSATVTRAIEHRLRSQMMTERDRIYVEGYLRHPEEDSALAEVAAGAIAAWEPWE